MKKHAIIPIFIPHKGCPNDCIFCNQKKITARSGAPTMQTVRDTIDVSLSTLTGRGLDTVEIAFFGGSFTGLPIEEQSAYLSVAAEYKVRRQVDKIHLSTRPDYIDREILDNLNDYGVDIIELGVQSFDDEVLKTAGRGHGSQVVYESAKLIQEYGFELGIQLMIGLPKDTLQKAIFSANETVKIAPKIARLYPTIVIEDTELYNLYQRGIYTPLTTEEAVLITKEMYKILDAAGIKIIRVGLKSTDLIREDGAIVGHTYHPAFRQLVEGQIAREKLEAQLLAQSPLPQHSVFTSNEKCFSNMIGHNRVNKQYFEDHYPDLYISYKINRSLADNQYIMIKYEINT